MKMLDDVTLSAIQAETAKAEAQHGSLPNDLNRQFMILMEEVGEVAQSMIELSHGRGSKDAVVIEAIQVASVAARVAEAAERMR